MISSNFPQVLKVTVGATGHLSMHSITFGVPLKYTKRSHSRIEAILPRHWYSKWPFQARWLECHCSYLTEELSWSSFSLNLSQQGCLLTKLFDGRFSKI